MSRLFLTGGTGFVGRRVIDRLVRERRETVALVRSAENQLLDTVTPVRGDLLDPASYRDALSGCDTVLHLAALTGNAAASEHRRINLTGTTELLRQARKAGVRRFLFVSTIAAGFPDLRRYPYAQAKLEAESAVRESELETLIVRPTMVLGQDSPILAALARLAAMPILPIFGRGDTPVQPIHVEDLSRLLLQIVDSLEFDGATIELGGSTILTIEELLREIGARTGNAGRSLHLPLAPLLLLLAAVEPMVGRWLPLTTGQLGSFRFDGTARPDEFWRKHRGELSSLASMLGAEAAA